MAAKINSKIEPFSNLLALQTIPGNQETHIFISNDSKRKGGLELYVQVGTKINEISGRYVDKRITIPGTKDLEPCTDITLLHRKCKIIIILECKGNIGRGNAFAIPFIYDSKLNENKIFKVVTPLFIKTNGKDDYKSYNKNQLFEIDDVHLQQLIDKNNIYYEPAREIAALGAVNPNSRGILTTGNEKVNKFPVRPGNTTQSRRLFSNVLGFVAPFLPKTSPNTFKGGKKSKHTRRYKKLTRYYKKN